MNKGDREDGRRRGGGCVGNDGVGGRKRGMEKRDLKGESQWGWEKVVGKSGKENGE